MANIELIKKKVDDIKIDLESLKKETHSFEQKKDKFSDEIKKQKEELLIQQTTAIEVKKSEIDKMLIDIKLDQLDQAQSQKYIEVQTELAKIGLDLEGLKQETWYGRLWKWIKEKSNQAREWAKENPKTAIAATAGIGLLVRWIKKLFSKSEEEWKEEEWNKKEKKEKKSRWKKALTWAGIWVGWALVWKNWDKISDWFGSLFDKWETPPPPENTKTGDFESLSEEMKQKYYALSSDVDTFPRSSPVVFSENGTDDQKIKWEIFFGLDKESKNLYDFSTNNTLDYIQDETTDGITANIMNWGKTKMYLILWPYLSKLSSFKPFWIEFLSDPVKAFNEWLKAATPEEREKTISLCYREYMNILNYVAEKKKILIEKLAKEEVLGLSHIKDVPTEDQQDAIDNLIDNDERRVSKSDAFFKKHTLADLPWLTKQYGIEINDISLETQELLDDLEEEKNNILDKDDNWETAITRAETDFLDGTLESDSRDKLVDLCENLLDIEFWDTSKSFFTAYTHLITDIFAGNTELAESFMEKTKTKEQIEEFRAVLTWYIEKLKANTFTQEDLKTLKIQSETYFKTKDQYELSVNNIKEMSSGLHFDATKALTLPWNAVKDLGKAFGFSKTNSWRERVWYGLGWFYITGQTLYIWSKLIPWSSLLGFVVKPIAWYAGKFGIEVGKLPITLVGKSLKLLTGKSFFAWWKLNSLILNSQFTSIEKERLVRYAFLHGEISEHKALKLYEKMWNKTIKNLDALLEEFGIQGKSNIELFKKYSNNKNIRKLLIESKTYRYIDFKDRVKHTFVDRILKKDILINSDNFKKLTGIDNILWTVATKWSKEALFREEFLKNTRTLDRVEEFIKNKKMMWLLIDVGNKSDDYLRLSKLIAKNFHTFKNLDELEWYLNFLKVNKSSITNTNTFVANTIGKWNKIKLMTPAEQVKYIESAKLNTSFLEKRINAMKDNFKKSAEFLRKLIKNKKTPYPQSVAWVANWLDDIAKVSNEDLVLLAKSEHIWKWSTLSWTSKNILSKFTKIFQNPGMKYAGKILWKVLGIWTVVLWWASAYQTYQEWSKLKLINKERGELLQEESFVDIWLTAAGACAFIPGIGWIASGVIVWVTLIASEVKEAFFDTIDKYNKNYKDFLGQAPLTIREHIITTILGGAETDRSGGEWMVWLFRDMSHLSAKTWSEGIKALLYTDEWKNNPLAMIDVNNVDQMDDLAKNTPPITRMQVTEAIDQVEKNVKTRYEYLKKKCGIYKEWTKDHIDLKKILTVDKIKNWEWLLLLDRLILQSQYALTNPEFYWDPQKIEQQQKENKTLLDKDKQTFTVLEWLYTKDKQSLLYLYRYTNDYRQHLKQFWFYETGKSLEPQYDAIIKNMDYFDAYMQYKIVDQWIDVSHSSSWFVEANFITLRNFFVSFALNKPISDKELYNSSSKLQTILYRIATEVVGVSIPNTMDELKKVFSEEHEKKYWIYFEDDGRLNVNGNYISDTEYNWTDRETIKKIREDIQEQMKDGDLIDVWTWDKILNNEIGNRYLKIIDQEMQRS